MRIFNSYVIILAVAFTVTTIILTALGQTEVDVYYILYIIESLITTELYVYLNSKARRALNLVSLLLFGGFMIIVVRQVASILG